MPCEQRLVAVRDIQAGAQQGRPRPCWEEPQDGALPGSEIRHIMRCVKHEARRSSRGTNRAVWGCHRAWLLEGQLLAQHRTALQVASR
jgi:hypothetical protein